MGPDVVQALIEKFGTQEALAEAVGTTQSSVAGWKSRGTIPTGQLPKIVAAARKRGIRLTLEDLVPETSDEARQ
jgi:transcriptional regulator with XRE-family HTH domain